MPEILLCGAEGEQFLFENDLQTAGADDKRRGSVQLLQGQQMFRQFDQGYADFWVHFRVAPGESNSTFANSGTLMTISSGGVGLCRIYTEESKVFTGYYSLDVVDAWQGTYDDGIAVPHTVGEFINYDIRVQVTTDVTPNDTLTVTFYRNEVLRRRATYVDSGGWGLPDTVLFQSRTNSSYDDLTHYQDVIITDALPTVGMELATLVPSAVGSYSDFTNDYTAIDDSGYNQSSVISTTAADTRESWFFADPEFNIGDKVIYGMAVTMVAQTDLSGVISDFEPFVRIGAIDYSAPTVGANNVAPNAYTTVFTENPSTSAPWSQAELVGLESGVRAV